MKVQDSIPSVQKAIRILHAIAGTSSNYSIAELSKSLGIPQTTVFRIIRTFVAADWVRPRISGTGYCLSNGMVPLLEPFLAQRVLIDVVRAPLVKLVEQTGLGIKLSIREGFEALTIFRLESPRSMGISVRVGTKFPLVFGSSGAALICDSSEEQIREIIRHAPDGAWKHQKIADVQRRINECSKNGICKDMGQYVPHIHTLSVPIRGLRGKIVAAVTLLGMPGDFEPAKVQNYKKHLLAMALECQYQLQNGANTQFSEEVS